MQHLHQYLSRRGPLLQWCCSWLLALWWPTQFRQVPQRHNDGSSKHGWDLLPMGIELRLPFRLDVRGLRSSRLTMILAANHV